MAKKKTADKNKIIEREPFHYKLGGIELVMEPMKIKQVKEFFKLLGSIDVKEGNDITFNKIINLLFEDYFQKILGIVFGPAAYDIDLDELDYEEVDPEVEAMRADFLSLNPSLIKRLKEFAAIFASNLKA